MSGKGGVWAGVLALVAFVGAAATLIGNLGGARDAVCKTPFANARCVEWGLIAPADDPSVARNALLARVEGLWGNAGREGEAACTTTMRYRLSRRDNEDYITLSAQDYVSEGRIVSAENNSVFTRTVTPAAQAGTQWELRFEADRLIQVDNAGTPTPLVRCDG